MKLPFRILIVDDDPGTLEAISDLLKEAGYEIDVASNGQEAIRKARQNKFEVVITDLSMPRMDGMELLGHFMKHQPDTYVIMLTGVGTIATAVEAMKQGAFDYLSKPAKSDEILLVLKRAEEMMLLRAENDLLRSQLKERYCFDKIIGKSEPMQAIYRMIERVARTDSTILITGESGTGKELIANAVHYNSERKDKPFIPINCGAIPEELLESELFGHEKGSFTGAYREHLGRFELAHQGTIFLDEIGEMSPKLQVKLLRFLQEKKFERVGGARTIQVDTRIVAATNKDLEKMVSAGSFREDLFYRLNVIPIRVPPLRERIEDIPLLIQHFLKQHSQKKDIPLKRISKAALSAMQAYSWPGNVRELENAIERLVILTEGDEIQMEDLPQRMAQMQAKPSFSTIGIEGGGIDLKGTLEELENSLILEALKKAGGVKNQAAKLLGLNRTTLIEKMKKKKLCCPDPPDK
ncbi:sigma-54-dependent transcriptional regulator [Desulforhabdus amnigena]|jgi:DNA-binding NtrC family response regulator|uniref:Acetoacetate metabolism regulatory protein AtoC n=1 Tax=Desulforhabdus amnigena TaxID=40218 RepID=A0A9W6D5E0_9BACT|nr:sigma-54 dependent transcriptional regulator [Desulforhabdus amnigena]GLI33596.1 acetoacetate metabolism regulatory protein AtoC [Desulforhabdus amnigena]